MASEVCTVSTCEVCFFCSHSSATVHLVVHHGAAANNVGKKIARVMMNDESMPTYMFVVGKSFYILYNRQIAAHQRCVGGHMSRLMMKGGHG